jgi:hypothetical protein
VNSHKNDGPDLLDPLKFKQSPAPALNQRGFVRPATGALGERPAAPYKSVFSQERSKADRRRCDFSNHSSPIANIARNFYHLPARLTERGQSGGVLRACHSPQTNTTTGPRALGGLPWKSIIQNINGFSSGWPRLVNLWRVSGSPKILLPAFLQCSTHGREGPRSSSSDPVNRSDQSLGFLLRRFDMSTLGTEPAKRCSIACVPMRVLRQRTFALVAKRRLQSSRDHGLRPTTGTGSRAPDIETLA